MRQTLFHIPHEVTLPGFGSLPVFGLGLLLAAWLVFSLTLMAWNVHRQGWNAETRSYLPVICLISLAIVFVLPKVEETIAGRTLGLPIRGYGVFMLIAVVAGVALAAYRAKRMGINPEVIFSLAFCMVIAGIIGARAFFILQYWDELRRPTMPETLGNMLDMTKGGLVVYGSLIGAIGAATVFLWRRGLPALALYDLIAPSMLLGLAVGRIGCLMNGCCFGGHCERGWAVTFPRDSPPYIDQLSEGAFHGFRIVANDSGQVVLSGSTLGDTLQPGDRIVAINGHDVADIHAARRLIETGGTELVLTNDRHQQHRFSLSEFPERSKPIHPTQIYSAINAALLCLLAIAIYPFRQRDGQVIALVLTLYPISRFMLEKIRTDERGQFGTELTISQNISIAVLVCIAILWIYVLLKPRRVRWPLAEMRNASAPAESSLTLSEPLT